MFFFQNMVYNVGILIFHSSTYKAVEKRLQSEEEFEILFINNQRGTYIPINFSNSKNGPVDIELIVEGDDCLFGEK